MHKEIIIIKGSMGKRKVQYAGYVIGEYELLESAKTFAIRYEYGLWIEVWENNLLCEKIDKVIG